MLKFARVLFCMCVCACVFVSIFPVAHELHGHSDIVLSVHIRDLICARRLGFGSFFDEERKIYKHFPYAATNGPNAVGYESETDRRFLGRILVRVGKFN